MAREKVYASGRCAPGASGYIMKEESGEHLVTAIQRVLDGGIYLSETMAGRILKSMASPNSRNARITPAKTYRSRI